MGMACRVIDCKGFHRTLLGPTPCIPQQPPGPVSLMPYECFMQAHDCALTSGYFVSTLAIACPFRGVYTEMKRRAVVGSGAVRQLKLGRRTCSE